MRLAAIIALMSILAAPCFAADALVGVAEKPPVSIAAKPIAPDVIQVAPGKLRVYPVGSGKIYRDPAGKLAISDPAKMVEDSAGAVARNVWSEGQKTLRLRADGGGEDLLTLYSTETGPAGGSLAISVVSVSVDGKKVADPSGGWNLIPSNTGARLWWHRKQEKPIQSISIQYRVDHPGLTMQSGDNWVRFRDVGGESWGGFSRPVASVDGKKPLEGDDGPLPLADAVVSGVSKSSFLYTKTTNKAFTDLRLTEWWLDVSVVYGGTNQTMIIRSVNIIDDEAHWLSDIRNAADGTAVTTPMLNTGTARYTAGSPNHKNKRTMIPFDLSTFSSGTITGAVFMARLQKRATNYTADCDLCLAHVSPNNTPPTTADYDQITWTEYARETVGNVVDAWHTYTLNSAGVAYLQTELGSTAWLGLVTQVDFDADWAALSAGSSDFSYSYYDSADSGSEPYLELTFAPTPTPSDPSFGPWSGGPFGGRGWMRTTWGQES